MTFLLYIFLLSYSFIYSSKTIKQKFYIVTSKKFLVLPIIIAQQSMNLVIDINADYTWMTANIYDYVKSKSFGTNNSTVKFIEDIYVYNGIYSYDDFQFENSNSVLNRFPFILVNNKQNDDKFEGAIALNQRLSEYSFINKMIDNKLISHTSFSLDFIDPYEGTIEFGEDIKQNDNIGQCQLIKNNLGKWGCSLNKISFGENTNTYVIDNPIIYFDTIYNQIFVPKNFFNYLKNDIFHISDNSSCKVITNELEFYKFNEIICSDNQTNDEMNITINGYVYRINSLFNCYEGSCHFLVIYKYQIEDFVLGYTFLKQFHSVFDYEENKIFFSSNDNRIFKEDTRNTINHVIYLFILVVLGGILLLLAVYINQMKNQTKNEHQSFLFKQFQRQKSQEIK